MNKYEELLKNNESIDITTLDYHSLSFLDRYFIYCILTNNALMMKDRHGLVKYTGLISCMLMINQMCKKIERDASELVEDKYKDIANITLPKFDKMLESEEIIFQTNRLVINYIIFFSILLVIGIAFSFLSFYVFNFPSIVHILVNIAILIYAIFILPHDNTLLYRNWIMKKINEMDDTLDEPVNSFFKGDYDMFIELKNKYGELLNARNDDEIIQAIKNLPKN